VGPPLPNRHLNPLPVRHASAHAAPTTQPRCHCIRVVPPLGCHWPLRLAPPLRHTVDGRDFSPKARAPIKAQELAGHARETSMPSDAAVHFGGRAVNSCARSFYQPPKALGIFARIHRSCPGYLLPRLGCQLAGARAPVAATSQRRRVPTPA
jgi:hypothetical protein